MAMVDVDRYEASFLGCDQVLAVIGQALAERRPFSLARVGTAEIAVLSHAFDPRHWPMQPYIAYSGVTRFELATTRRLHAALRRADLLGLLPLGHSHGPQTRRLLLAYRLKPGAVCNAFLPKDLAVYQPFIKLLAETRLVVIGRRAAESVQALQRYGVKPVAVYDLEGLDALDDTLAAIEAGPDFDLALFAAGVPATIGAVEIAQRLGKVALDFGHGLDILIDEDRFDYPKLERTWWSQYQQRVAQQRIAQHRRQRPVRRLRPRPTHRRPRRAGGLPAAGRPAAGRRRRARPVRQRRRPRVRGRPHPQTRRRPGRRPARRGRHTRGRRRVLAAPKPNRVV